MDTANAANSTDTVQGSTNRQPATRATAVPAAPIGEVVSAVPVVPGQSSSGDSIPAVPVVPVASEDRRPGGLTPATLLITLFLAYLLLKIQIVIVLLIAGILLATAIGGPVEWLHKHRNIGRGPAILLVYLLLLSGLGLFFYLLIPPIAREAGGLARDFPNRIETLRTQVQTSDNSLIRTGGGRLFAIIGGYTSGGGGGAAATPGLAFGVLQGLGGVIVTLFTLFLIAFYWITEKPLVKRAIVSVFAPSQRRRVLHLWHEVEGKLGSWIRGQLILMAVVGVLATTAYGLMGLPFWLILGVIAGLTEAIPAVGPILGAVPAVILALTEDWKLALAVVAFVIVLQLLENAVLVPRIMRGTVGLTPLTIILAILAGSEFQGLVGALLAIPVAGAIQVILGDLLAEKRRRDAAEQEPPRGFLRFPFFGGRRGAVAFNQGQGQVVIVPTAGEASTAPTATTTTTPAATPAERRRR